MLIEIIIDTNGNNYQYDKYPYNEELWNIIVPNIKYLGSYEGLQPTSEIDWDKTRLGFEKSNGHCIIQKSGGYIAAYEYESLYFERDFLNSVADFIYPHQPLSFLLAEIAIKNGINWSFVEEYKKEAW